MRSRTLPYKDVVATVSVAALFIARLNTTIVNVALPTLLSGFHAAFAVAMALCVESVLLALPIPARLAAADGAPAPADAPAQPAQPVDLAGMVSAAESSA